MENNQNNNENFGRWLHRQDGWDFSIAECSKCGCATLFTPCVPPKFCAHCGKRNLWDDNTSNNV